MEVGRAEWELRAPRHRLHAADRCSDLARRQWIAYAANPSGLSEVFVQPAMGGTRYQVSRGGGHHPLWFPDGTELTWDVTAGRSDAVRVMTRPTFSFGVPGPPLVFTASSSFRPVDMMRDGRILGAVDETLQQNPQQATGAVQIQVVENWFEDLKARFAGGS